MKRDYIAVAERALGRALPKGAVVHHVNLDPFDNRPSNLVICPNQTYHLLLHTRMRALDACGHADWRKCVHCKKYDAPENLVVVPCRAPYHKRCVNEYHVKRVRIRKAKVRRRSAGLSK